MEQSILENKMLRKCNPQVIELAVESFKMGMLVE